MSDGKVDIPAQLIEATAKAIVRHRFTRESMWDDPFPEGDPEAWREGWRIEATAVLAAAFAECEVTEQWRVRTTDPVIGEALAAHLTRADAEAQIRYGNQMRPDRTRELLRRLVITTPAVVVTPNEGDQQ